MSWWQVLLFPFAAIYDLITRFRNHLYNIEFKRSFEFEANIISVGNLSVGGTGKTPMVTYLVDHFLKENKSVATLSRGYGRKTKGFRICTEEDNPQTVGDEPFGYYEKYQSKVLVTVGEDRALAIPFILAESPELDVILLDDAFQHRSVSPSLNILLTTLQKPFWGDFVMPSGYLRESRKGAYRADAIIVTKSTQEEYFEELDKLGKPFFQTRVVYNDPVYFFGNESIHKVVIVSGLADNSPFIQFVSDKFDIVEIFQFADHHNYDEKDVNRIIKDLNGQTSLITTEKDFVKLRRFEKFKRFNCVYIPIKIRFIKDEERFLQMVEKSLKDYKLNQ